MSLVSNWISAAYPGAVIWRHWSLRKRKRNRVHMFCHSLNPGNISRSSKPEALVSMWMEPKRSTYVLSQSESQQHIQEQQAGGIGLYVNGTKTEYMCFKREEPISALNSGPLKLVDKFTYLGSYVTSTESYVNIHQWKSWTAINRLSIMWKVIYPIKWNEISSKQW